MKKTPKFILALFLTFQSAVFAQETSVSKPDLLDLLVNKKFKTNNSFSIYPNYSIQIASTEKDDAEKVFKLFSKNYPKEDATIIYSNPYYKVIVGNFRNKIEAVSFLNIIKSDFPNAFIVKLKK